MYRGELKVNIMICEFILISLNICMAIRFNGKIWNYFKKIVFILQMTSSKTLITFFIMKKYINC